MTTQTEEKKKKSVKVFTDKDGNNIPSTYILKSERDSHAACEKLFKKAHDLSTRLSVFKTEAFALCDDLFAQLMLDNKVVIRDNAKGGYSLTTIDKSIKVEVRISETIHFDDRINLAQELIKQYLEEVTKDANPDLATLVNNAFKSNKNGLDVKSIIGLFKLTITHTKWVQAMELLKQSMQVNNTKRYMRIFKKDDQGDYQQVKLDFSNV